MSELNDYEIVGDVELPEEEAEIYNKMIAEADQEIEEIRVSFRWRSKQLDMVKKAAEIIGVPYQTYMKTILFKQSVEDIKKAQEVSQH